jgi:hypothetical protein
MKLCKDCVYFRQTDRCAKIADPITGEPYRAGEDWLGSARLQRTENWLGSILMGSCGRRARWFKSNNAVRVK